MPIMLPKLENWLRVRTEWLVVYKDKISSAASIVGLAIALGGFWLTIAQLGRTAEALRATNSYQIQKDARELAEKLRVDNVFGRACRPEHPLIRETRSHFQTMSGSCPTFILLSSANGKRVAYLKISINRSGRIFAVFLGIKTSLTNGIKCRLKKS